MTVSILEKDAYVETLYQGGEVLRSAAFSQATLTAEMMLSEEMLWQAAEKL